MFDLVNDVVNSTGDVNPGLQFGAHNGMGRMIEILRHSSICPMSSRFDRIRCIPPFTLDFVICFRI
jgi:hypothetical protein